MNKYIFIVLIGLLLSGSSWFCIEEINREQGSKISALKLKNISEKIEIDFNNKMAQMLRMAARWEGEYDGTKRIVWEVDAQNVFEHDESYQALEWVNSSGVVKWVVPEKNNEQAINFDLTKEEKWRESLEFSKINNVTTLSKPIDLMQGGKGIFVYFPLYIDDVFDGHLVSVLNVNKWISAILNDIGSEYVIEMFCDSQFVWRCGDVDNGSDLEIQEVTIDLLQKKWVTKMFISNKALADMAGSNHQVFISLMFLLLTFSIVGWSKRNDAINKINVLKLVSEGLKDNNIELLEAKKAASENDVKFKSVVETAADAIITIDEFGIISFVNNAFLKLFLCPSENDAVGKNISEFMADPHKKNHDEYLRKYMKTGIRKIIGIGREVEAKMVDGTLFPMYLNVSTFYSDDKIMFTGVVHDLRRKKNDEKKLLKANFDAEQARIKAENAARTKANFLANMSHEIRTPMNAVLGLTSLVLETELDDEQRDSLNTIQEAGELLLTVINDILDFSKIESEKLTLEILPVNLKHLIKNVIEVLKVSAIKRNIALNVEYKDGFVESVFADCGRVMQIMFNLVGNALKFTDNGDVTIVLSSYENDGQNWTKIAVQDTGIGLPEDANKILFNKFTQADESTTRKFGGTGLGLTICQQLATLMKGSICCQNRLEGGSEFIVDLPLNVCEHQSDYEIVFADKKINKIDANLKIKILVVEDNIINQKVIGKMLKKESCLYDCAANGLEAIQMVDRFEYDIILMDMQMPEMNGLEATENIRCGPKKNRNIPIIALTANVLNEDKERCFNAGMNDYISKPVDRDVLIQKIVKWCDRIEDLDLSSK